MYTPGVEHPVLVYVKTLAPPGVSWPNHWHSGINNMYEVSVYQSYGIIPGIFDRIEPNKYWLEAIRVFHT